MTPWYHPERMLPEIEEETTEEAETTETRPTPFTTP